MPVNAISQPRTIRILCAITAAIDGFDVQAIGFVGPSIARELGFAQGQLGWIFSANLFGAMIGGILFGQAADRHGRKPLLILSCIVTGAGCAATLLASGVAQLITCRFIAGIGLGGATPCFMGLGVESVPESRRNAVAAALYAAFPAGALIGSLASAPLLSVYGWRGVIAMGAILPLIIGLVLAAVLREPPRVKLDQALRPGVMALLSPALRAKTFALWPLFFLCFPVIGLLALWLPALVQQLGVSAGQASLLLASLSAGSVLASWNAGWLVNRLGLRYTLLPALLAGALTWPLMASSTHAFARLVVFATCAGMFIGGVTTALIAVVASTHPSEIRATAIGWATAFGRAGQTIAPSIVGLLVSGGTSAATLIALCGTPLLLALVPGVALVLVARKP